MINRENPLLPLTFATACSFLSYFHIATYFNFLFHFSCSLEDELVVLSVSKEVQELVHQPLYFILISFNTLYTKFISYLYSELSHLDPWFYLPASRPRLGPN